MSNRLKQLLFLAAAASTVGCSEPRPSEAQGVLAAAGMATDPDRDSIARARRDSINRAQPGYIVDSILPGEEAMRRFTADIANPPRALANGAKSREALVVNWVRALEANDARTLIRLTVNRPEFAFLVYPSSPTARPPLQQRPDVAWMLLSNASVQGFRRALSKHGGKRLGYVGHECAGAPEVQGLNRVWVDCTLRMAGTSGDTVVRALFGPIIERNGHFKFLSLAGDL